MSKKVVYVADFKVFSNGWTVENESSYAQLVYKVRQNS